MKYLLVIATYPDDRQRQFEEQHSPRNKKYCSLHRFKYIEVNSLNWIPEKCQQRHVFWYRWFFIQYLMNNGFLKDGDIIAHLDADICIVNGKLSFVPPKGKSFAYAIDSCNTHCMGAFTIKVNDWSRGMVDNLLNEERWEKFKDTPFWKMFHDQASWYSLAGIKSIFGDPNQLGWDNFPYLGWGSDIENKAVYSIEELIENVEILPVEWNVTTWRKNNVYFRFPTKTEKKEDVIFRHFASKVKWEEEWAKIKMI